MKTYTIEISGTGFYCRFELTAESGEIGECVKKTYTLRDDIYRLGFKDAETMYTEVIR